MLSDRDSLLRKLHELRSEHRDLDTVIARLLDRRRRRPASAAAAQEAQTVAEGRDLLAREPADPRQHRLTARVMTLDRRRWSASSWAASPTGRPCATPPNARAARRAARGAHRLRPPHARPPGRLRATAPRARACRSSSPGAGGAAHLPGMCAAWTAAAGARRAGRDPTALKGMDSLLSIVQMPAGHPGRHARDRPGGGGERGPARRRDPGDDRPGAGRRGSTPCAREQTAVGRREPERPARACMTFPPAAERDHRHRRRRPARPHVGAWRRRGSAIAATS